MSVLDSALSGAAWAGVALAQVTLLALLGLVAWLLARRGGPALRGAVLVATLVGLLLLPGLASLAPTWLPLPQCLCPASTALKWPAPIDVHPPAMLAPVADVRGITLQVELPPVRDRFDANGPGQKNMEEMAALAKAEAVFDLEASLEEVAPAEPAGEQPGRPWPVAAVATAVWLLGVLFCLGRSARQLVALYRCSWQAREVHDPEWVGEITSPARRDGLRAVSVRESPLVASPLTLGLFRPVILLPRGRKGWSAGERAMILEHELAHVRRRDFLAGLVAELVTCLCWFHPLVLWLAARLRLEQEFAADAWVASAVGDSSDYVRCLARLALEQRRGPPLPRSRDVASASRNPSED